VNLWGYRLLRSGAPHCSLEEKYRVVDLKTMNQLFQRLSSRKNRRSRSQDDEVQPYLSTPANHRGRWKSKLRMQESHDASTVTGESTTRAASVRTLVSSPGTPSIIAISSSPSSVMSPVSFVTVNKQGSNEEMESGVDDGYERDGDDYSDGYHRYDDEDDNFDVDYRGHYVPKQEKQDPIVRMALQASQEVSLSTRTKQSSNFQKTNHQGDTCQSLDASGNDLYEQGKIDQAFEKYEEALQLKRQSLLGQYNAMQLADISDEERARILASMATSINNLTYLRQVKGQASAEETLVSYEVALQIKREILGPEHISVAKTLNNIGSVHFLQHNYHEAAASYEQARDILQSNLGCEHLDVCTVTSNLGDVHCSMGQWQRAVKEYRDALNLRWKLLGPTDPKVVRLMEQIAELEMKIGKSASAKEDDARVSTSYYGPVLKDVHKLQAELRQDLQHLDSLERQLPIDMIKDRTRVFKELRELKVDEEDDKNGEHEIVAPPCLENPFQFPLSDTPSKELGHHEPSPLTPVGLPDLPTKTCTATPTTTGKSHNDLCLPREDRKSPSTTTCSATSVVAVAVPEACGNMKIVERDELMAARGTPQSPRASLDSASKGAPSRPSPSRKLTNKSDSVSYQHLTPEERKLALTSVRERLAELRAARDKVPDDRTALTPTTGASPQMQKPWRINPIASPQNVLASPSLVLLKTSELLTMKQGINSLRDFSTDSSTVARNTRSYKPRPTRARTVTVTAKVSHTRIISGTRRAVVQRINSTPHPAVLR
jgi:tetratricopeptide (TPR) repeat protein